MTADVQAKINQLAEQENEDLGSAYPTVAMQYEEMRRVALKGIKEPVSPQDIEAMMRYCFFVGYAHALTQQVVLQTRPASLADLVATNQLAESLTEVKRLLNYYGKQTTHEH